MGDCKAAGLELGEQRLDVAQHGLAGRGIAHMADRRASRQTIDGRGVGKVVADQPLPALGVKPHAVIRDDARGLLAAMLQSMEAKRSNGGGVGVIENAKNAALFAQSVAVRVEAGLPRRV